MLRYIKEVSKLGDNMKHKNKIELDEINDIYGFIDDVKQDLTIEFRNSKRQQQRYFLINGYFYICLFVVFFLMLIIYI